MEDSQERLEEGVEDPREASQLFNDKLYKLLGQRGTKRACIPAKAL